MGDADAQAAQAHHAVRVKTDRARALDLLFEHFRAATLAVSYGSNAALGPEELEALLRRHKRSVRRLEITHRYAFGTHRAAGRRVATEYVFVGS